MASSEGGPDRPGGAAAATNRNASGSRRRSVHGADDASFLGTSASSRAFGGARRAPITSPNPASGKKRQSSSGWDFLPFRRPSATTTQTETPTSSAKRLPMSSTWDDTSSPRRDGSPSRREGQNPQNSFPPWSPLGVNGSKRSTSYHAGQPGSVASPGARAEELDLESQERNSSAFSIEGGRNHHFIASSADPMDPFGTSYTATSDAIRGSTAQLAGMAMRSEDEPSNSGRETTRIDEAEEEDREALTPQVADSSPGEGFSHAGPSNLARALDALKDGRQADETGPQRNDSLKSRSSGSRTHTQSHTSKATEKTSLLSKRIHTNDESADREDVTPGHDSHTNASGFSVVSSSGEHLGSRSYYGYGALAQASNEETRHGSKVQHHESVINAEEPPLPAVWRFVPGRLRPGSNDRSVRECFSPAAHLDSLSGAVSKLTWNDILKASSEPVKLMPATILGVLMNILDGVSYGLITFPTSYPIFANFGGDGVSMFFVTCVIAQLTFTLGGSIFKGGNGSMMIEVVPFYHILCTSIITTIGDDNPKSIIATTMVAFALSSVFTGIAFLLLGLCRLGVLIGFFPRHILVGCIGGVGVFLIETGLEVSGRLEGEAGFQWNFETLQYYFQTGQMVALWGIPLALAIVLKLITQRVHHPLVMPVYFLAITPIFYLIAVAFCGRSVEQLRFDGWIFDIGNAGDAPFWRYFTYLDLSQTSFEALWKTMPTMISLTFFSVLHVPLNVPALGVSLKEDNVDVDRELTGHGISNLLAGAFCTVPNYLCFSNSLLFYRVGGGSVLSGLMLAGATAVILIIGPGAINFLNVSTVGALIFLLGIDLCKEAIWDTIGRVNRWEYLTIWFIIIVMTLADFVIGILAGICLACLFLTIQMSRRKTVRACFDGSIARSTVRRPMTQRKFLEAVGTQTQILKLQGFLFFATINSVEALIRRALDIATWQHKPMRFLVIDFSLVSGLDFSAAEAFTRVQRLLDAKDVVLVFCGLTPDSEMGVALRSVDLWADRGLRIEAFPSLNEALEWTENSYLRGMYSSSLAAGRQLKQASLGAHGALDVPDTKRRPAFVIDEAFENSPRRHHLHEAAKRAVRKSEAGRPLERRSFEVTNAYDDDDNHEDAQGVPPTRVLSGDGPTASFQSSKTITASTSDHNSTDSELKPPATLDSRSLSPAQGSGVSTSSPSSQPLDLLMATFSSYTTPEMDVSFFRRVAPYFDRISIPRGATLWNQGDAADALYIIESGALKATYGFQQEDFEVNEAMLAGTIAGELSFLSRQKRNTWTRAELDCVLWKLDANALDRIEREHSLPSTVEGYHRQLAIGAAAASASASAAASSRGPSTNSASASASRPRSRSPSRSRSRPDSSTGTGAAAAAMESKTKGTGASEEAVVVGSKRDTTYALLVALLLRVSSEEQEGLLGYLVSRLS